MCFSALLAIPQHKNLLDLDSSSERMQIYAGAVSRLTLFGSGIGTFAAVTPPIGNKVAEHAHNDAIELATETGLPGVLLAAVLSVLVMARSTGGSRLALIALGAISLFGFPFHSPATAFMGAVVAGHASRGWSGICVRQSFRALAFRLRHGKPGLPFQVI
jgi:hypothetical protein